MQASVKVTVPALFYLSLFLAVVCLAPALHGPFLFDDFPNLAQLRAFGGWTPAGLTSYLLLGESGPGGRPLSMLSFLLDDISWPSDPYPFKYTNVMIHLLNGCLVAWLVILLRKVLIKRFELQPEWVAMVVCAIWLLNPYQVSSVMYVVQRMALLATTCVLAGLVMYVRGRAWVDDGRRSGHALMLAGYAVGGGLGALCKENALLFVWLVPLVEWLVFSGEKGRSVMTRVLVVAPALLLLVVLASRWQGFLVSYEYFRDFSLAERLLSEGRALGYYLWRYLIPGVSYMEVLTDGFEKSTGLFSPWSTFVWLVLHTALILLAVSVRRRLPLFSLGVLFFYVAHSLESTVVPLELFYEHRNYLPSVFLFLGGLHAPARYTRVVGASLSVFVLVCAGLQFVRATFWSNESGLLAIMYQQNPSSERAVTTLAEYLERQHRPAEALALMRSYELAHFTGQELALNRMVMACYLGADNQTDVDVLLKSPEKYRSKAGPMTTQISTLSVHIKNGRCQELDFDDLKAFLDNYRNAFRRDSAALQSYYVSMAYVSYYSEGYQAFRQQGLLALKQRVNVALAASLCGQFYMLGAAEDSCDCYRQHESMLDIERSRTPRVFMQRLLPKDNQKKYAEYLEDMSYVCEETQQKALEEK